MSVRAYLRVSTDEQTTANQRPDIERLASAHGWTVDHWYADEGVSGTRRSRPGLDAMMRDVRPCDVLIVWRLDRLGRSMSHTMGLVADLDARNVRLLSVGEPWLDTAGPTRGLLVAIFAWVAEMERRTLVERTKAGLARAKAEGIRLGRPRASTVRLEAASARIAAGATCAEACRAEGVSPATLRRYRARA